MLKIYINNSTEFGGEVQETSRPSPKIKNHKLFYINFKI